MTLEELKKMEPHAVFATGISYDDRISDQPVRWVAKRGYIHDWAIYYASMDKTVTEVTHWGNKLYSKFIVKDIIACDEEMMQMYRL